MGSELGGSRRRLPVLLAAAVLVAAAGVAGVAMPASAKSASGGLTAVPGAASATVSCADVLFVGARGSGETGPGDRGWKPTKDDPYGLGGTVDSARRRLAADLAPHRTIQVESVSYVANGVQTLLHAPSQYFANLAVGVTWTLGVLGGQARNCPAQQIVLAGFSQGAMVMHRVLHDLGTTSSGRAILARVAAAILVGDGDEVPHDYQTRYGSASTDARGIGQSMRKISHASAAKFSPSLTARVLSVCNNHDIVCGWTDFNLVCLTDPIPDPVLCPVPIAAMVKIHLSYPGSQPLLAATDRAAALAREMPAPRPVSVAGAVGEPFRYQLSADIAAGFTLRWRTAPGATLPPGLALSTSGLVDGAPTTAGKYTTTVQVRAVRAGLTSPWLPATIKVTVSARGPWGNATEVPGTAALNTGGSAQVYSVSCATAGNCAAGGDYTDGSGLQAFVVSEVNGSWGTAIQVPGTAALNTRGSAQVYSLSCGSPGNCVAGGDYLDGSGLQAFVVSEVNGSWGTAIEVPGTAALNAGGYAYVYSVSCPSAGNCTAGGQYRDGLGFQPFVVSEVDGSWGTAIEVPGTAALNVSGAGGVESVSCGSAGNCSAGGWYGDSAGRSQAFVVSEVNGSWDTAIEVPGTAALNTGGVAILYSVSCPSAGNCSAGGVYAGAGGSVDQQSFVVSEVNGSWGTAIEVPGPSALILTSMSCASAGNCGAGGIYSDSSGSQTFVVSEVNGSWGTAIEVPGIATLNSAESGDVYSVSCGSPGNCVAGGYYTDSSGVQAFVVSEVNGSWGTAIEVPGTAALNTRGYADVYSVSCPSAGNCAAGGQYRDGSGHYQAFVVSERGAQ